MLSFQIWTASSKDIGIDDHEQFITRDVSSLYHKHYNLTVPKVDCVHPIEMLLEKLDATKEI
jgi:hypothetical protein